jgi:Zn-dependent protease with chaperone function
MVGGVDLELLRSSREKRLSLLMMLLAASMWLALVALTMGVGLIYPLVAAAVITVGQAVLIAHLRGEGVKLGPDQYPELHQKVLDASARLGLEPPPEAFLLNERGVLNAFATRFAGRNFIVLYTEIVEACEEHPGAIDFVIGHELGHLALGHLRWMPFLLPARILPLLGPAYSRACEYSCDRAGRHVAANLDGALRGLAVLASGGRLAGRLNIKAYAEQARELGRFWPAAVELGRTHPFTPKRVAALTMGSDRVGVRIPPRHPLAYPAAPLLGVTGGAAGGGVLVAVAVVGILAAIAIPNFIRYQERAETEELETAADLGGPQSEEELIRFQRQLQEVWGELPADSESAP